MALAQTNPRYQTAEDVATDMQRRIQTGEWPDGYRLPPERELAARYGLARNTVRSAMDRIGTELIRVVGRGTYVRTKGRRGHLGPARGPRHPAGSRQPHGRCQPRRGHGGPPDHRAAGGSARGPSG